MFTSDYCRMHGLLDTVDRTDFKNVNRTMFCFLLFLNARLQGSRLLLLTRRWRYCSYCCVGRNYSEKTVTGLDKRMYLHSVTQEIDSSHFYS